MVCLHVLQWEHIKGPTLGNGCYCLQELQLLEGDRRLFVGLLLDWGGSSALCRMDG